MKEKNTLIKNLTWKFSERIAAQGVSLILSIVLARMLEPSHYGIISIVTIFINLANVFVTDGFGSALIQKKDADELDFSSVLYFNVGFSIVLYAILFLTAPYIAKFYGNGYEILTPVLRVLGIRIIITGFNSIQEAYASRKMIFKNFFIATLAGAILSAIVGIGMAYLGYGVWALVGQYLTNTFINTIVLNLVLDIKFVPKFSIQRLKGLIGFGSKILGARLLITGFLELRALIIGKVYSSSDLAFYDKGRQFPNLIVNNIDTSIGAVLFPRMSKSQDNMETIKEMTRSSIRFSSYIMCPLMLGLAAVSETFVKVVLTEKWLPCVPLMQLFCVVYLFQPIHTANMQAIKAIGRSDVFFKLEVFKKTIELVTLFITMLHGVTAIVAGMAILTTLFTFVNAYPNSKLLSYTLSEQVKDLLGPIGMSVVMFIVVSFAGNFFDLTLMRLIVQVLLGGGVYVLLSVITSNQQFKYIINLIKQMIHF